jgi:hypothetical protein
MHYDDFGYKPRERDPVCVERWPEAETGSYDPRCCRFPKSCSADVYTKKEEPSMKITHEFYAGAKGVDESKMRANAQRLTKNGEGSVVHMHSYAEECQDECVTYPLEPEPIVMGTVEIG